MKISGYTMGLSSDYHSEFLDSAVEESRLSISKTRSPVQGGAVDQPLQVLVDRVSLSSSETREIQSSYSAALTGSVTVRPIDAESDETDESHSFQTLVERMVGGALDKDAVLRNLRPGEPVQDSNPVRSGSTWTLSLKRTAVHYESQSLDFQSSGVVTTEDGRSIAFSLDLSVERAFLSRTETDTLVQRWQERVNLIDPLVISLDGRLPGLSDAAFEFDLDHDGTLDHVSFVSPGSGFLAFDRNGDGLVNDGSELFGAASGNGFEELRALDQDGNQWIDENDAVFSRLSVWIRDPNGQDRLISLKEAGIGAISLNHAATDLDMTQADNTLLGRLKSTGVFLFENGKVGTIHQIDLADRPPEPEPISLKKAFASVEQSLFPAFSAPSSLSGFPWPSSAIEQPTTPPTNPYKDLLERIDALKAEMGRLLGIEKLKTGSKASFPPGFQRYRGLDGQSIAESVSDSL